jgi:hypothetical protein
MSISRDSMSLFFRWDIECLLDRNGRVIYNNDQSTFILFSFCLLDNGVPLRRINNLVTLVESKVKVPFTSVCCFSWYSMCIWCNQKLKTYSFSIFQVHCSGHVFFNSLKITCTLRLEKDISLFLSVYFKQHQ